MRNNYNIVNNNSQKLIDKRLIYIKNFPKSMEDKIPFIQSFGNLLNFKKYIPNVSDNKIQLFFTFENFFDSICVIICLNNYFINQNEKINIIFGYNKYCNFYTKNCSKKNECPYIHNNKNLVKNVDEFFSYKNFNNIINEFIASNKNEILKKLFNLEQNFITKNGIKRVNYKKSEIINHDIIINKNEKLELIKNEFNNINQNNFGQFENKNKFKNYKENNYYKFENENNYNKIENYKENNYIKFDNKENNYIKFDNKENYNNDKENNYIKKLENCDNNKKIKLVNVDKINNDKENNLIKKLENIDNHNFNLVSCNFNKDKKFYLSKTLKKNNNLLWNMNKNFHLDNSENNSKLENLNILENKLQKSNNQNLEINIPVKKIDLNDSIIKNKLENLSTQDSNRIVLDQEIKESNLDKILNKKINQKLGFLKLKNDYLEIFRKKINSSEIFKNKINFLNSQKVGIEYLDKIKNKKIKINNFLFHNF